MERKYLYLEMTSLYLIGCGLALRQNSGSYVIVPVLLAFILTMLLAVIERKEVILGLAGLSILSMFLLPVMTVFSPILSYMTGRRKYWHYGICSLGCVFIIGMDFTDFHIEFFYSVLIAGITLLAIRLSHRSGALDEKEQELRHMRDNSTENAMKLKSQNKELMEKQDYEIYLATLKERNRIAREIHDNVGHLLSRSLLQTGALLAVTDREKNPIQHAQLTGLKQSLDSAMNSIRESVHGLRDDAVDLKSAVYEMTKDLQERFEFKIDLDFSDQVPANVKLCFVACMKEALNNAVRYSDATQITLIIREHPALYQLNIADNGKVKPFAVEGGMGLNNMKERVEALHGVFHVDISNGFSIFISIRKEQL